MKISRVKRVYAFYKNAASTKNTNHIVKMLQCTFVLVVPICVRQSVCVCSKFAVLKMCLSTCSFYFRELVCHKSVKCNSEFIDVYTALCVDANNNQQSFERYQTRDGHCKISRGYFRCASLMTTIWRWCCLPMSKSRPTALNEVICEKLKLMRINERQ